MVAKVTFFLPPMCASFLHLALQPRTFMALGPWLRSLDTPEATKRVWDDLL